MQWGKCSADGSGQATDPANVSDAGHPSLAGADPAGDSASDQQERESHGQDYSPILPAPSRVVSGAAKDTCAAGRAGNKGRTYPFPGGNGVILLYLSYNLPVPPGPNSLFLASAILTIFKYRPINSK